MPYKGLKGIMEGFCSQFAMPAATEVDGCVLCIYFILNFTDHEASCNRILTIKIMSGHCENVAGDCTSYCVVEKFGGGKLWRILLLF